MKTMKDMKDMKKKIFSQPVIIPLSPFRGSEEGVCSPPLREGLGVGLYPDELTTDYGRGTETWRRSRYCENILHSGPLYYVSDIGRVASLRHEWSAADKAWNMWLRVLKPRVTSCGYLMIWGYDKMTKRMKAIHIHHLVAYAWLGPRPEGCDIDHINHRITDNSVGNLRYLPSRENQSYFTPIKNGKLRTSEVLIEPIGLQITMCCRGWKEASMQLGVDKAYLRHYVNSSGGKQRVRGCLVTNLTLLAEMRQQQVDEATEHSEKGGEL